MKLKCIMCDRRSVTFTEGALYEAKPSDFYKDEFVVTNDYGNRDTVPLDGALWKFEIVEPSGEGLWGQLWEEAEQRLEQKQSQEPVQVAVIRSIQEQCSRANLSISIDPEGFNIFDCDTDMQTMVHSAADAVEILETKLEYKDSMGKWGWQ